MNALDAVKKEIDTLLDVYGNADLSYATLEFACEVRGRVDGIKMCRRVVEAASQAVKTRHIEPLGPLHGAQIPFVVHYMLNEMASAINALNGEKT